MPKVSVICPVYNCAAYIKDCIDSLMAQTMQDFEVLLVDDHGQDKSIEVAKMHLEGKSDKFRFLQTPENSGPGVARNVGIDAAKGEYIAFIDSDDQWKPTFLERLLEAAEDKDLAYCQLQYSNGRVHRNPVLDAGDFSGKKKIGFLLHFVTFSVCFLYRKSFLADNNLKFPCERNSEDTNFLTRSLLLAQSIACVDEPLYIYNVHLESLTTSHDRSKFKQRLSAANKLMRSFSEMKDNPRYKPLNLKQYNFAMLIIYMKKGVAQALKEWI